MLRKYIYIKTFPQHTHGFTFTLRSLLSHPSLFLSQTEKIIWYSPLGIPNHAIKGMMQGHYKMGAIMAN